MAYAPLRGNDANEMMTMRGQRVPSFLYNADTAQTAFDWDGVSELKLMKYLGNVVWNGIIANFLTWVPFIFFPWLTLVATGLRQDGSAHFPVLLVCLLCFGSTITYNVWLEFESLKDVLPCVLRVARPTILGCKVPWYVFLVYCGVFTLICHLDTMTNALFLAKLFTSPDRQHLIFGLISVGYAGVVLWLMMLGQAFFVLLSVFPIGRVVNWEVEEQELEFFPGFDFEKKDGGQNVVYQTCLERVQNHHTIFVIADCARWSSIKGLQGSYMEEFHRPRRQGSTAFKMLKKTILRSMLFLLLESVFFLSLQCYVYAFVRAQTTTTLNLVSILLSAASGFYHAACDATLVLTFWRHLSHGHQQFLNRPVGERKKVLRYFPQEYNIIGEAQCWVAVFGCSTLLVFVLLFGSVVLILLDT